MPTSVRSPPAINDTIEAIPPSGKDMLDRLVGPDEHLFSLQRYSGQMGLQQREIGVRKGAEQKVGGVRLVWIRHDRPESLGRKLDESFSRSRPNSGERFQTYRCNGAFQQTGLLCCGPQFAP